MPFSPPPACDLFCRVVDNFGDVAVCWRVARQLAGERGWTVRLLVDDLSTFARLCPAVDPTAARQTVDGVDIEHWSPSSGTEAAQRLADVVVEAFACDVPDAYLAAMAQRDPKPVWINLEYLSGEDWVADFHLRASPHPRLPLIKHFFFPGLGAGTGGVVKERGLDDARRAFVAPDVARSAFWNALLGAEPPPDATVVSLFGYENPAVDALFAAWRDGDAPVVCVVPEGRLSGAAARFAGVPRLGAGVSARRGKLTLHGAPFTDQPRYDRLLWACDLNFVRGEDSFVRAQWAERPFVWHIYPQADDAHLPKLDAALTHYAAGLDAEARRALADFWHAWNSSPRGGAAPDWPRFWRHRTAFAQRAASWAHELAGLGNLVDNLADFSESRLK